MFYQQAMTRPPRLPAASGARPRPRSALLLNPFYPKDPHASFGKHVLTPSLALTSIAASTPAHWELAFWDENLLQGPPPAEPLPAVVGITVHLTFARRAFELADWYRNQGSKVVLGGLHLHACADEARAHADALVVGDGTWLWGEVLADIEAGQLRAEYRTDYRRPYRESPAPRREILPRESFLTTASLIATRGCHNRCGFCYLATDGLKMPYQVKQVEDLCAEIRQDAQPYLVFIDNNLGSRKDYLYRLCEALEPLEKIWSAAVSIDVADDPELVRRMALAGCTGVFVGFESLEGGNLDDAHKRSPRPEDYARRVRLFHAVGIQVNGSFVFGFDRDTPETFARTVQWIEENRLECATFHILTPYPGTPLFRQLQAEGRLRHRDWDRYDTAHVVFEPRQMSREQLAQGYAWAYRRLFSLGSIWRRRPRDARAVPAYLAMSLLYKRCNWLWPVLIRFRLVHRVWRPLIELSRRRHLRFRRRLAAQLGAAPGNVVSPGV